VEEPEKAGLVFYTRASGKLKVNLLETVRMPASVDRLML
jgi:hypothetical protein